MSTGSFAYTPKVLKQLSSPGFFMNTRRGTLYQLTPHNQEPLNLNNLIISQSDFQHCDKLLDALAENSMSFKRYLGFNTPEEQAKKMIYLSPVDYYKQSKSIDATSKPNTVKLFSNRGGFVEVTDEEYYNISKKINPDILVSLTEVPSGTGKKSHKRSVEKTLNFLDKAISIFRPSGESNKNTLIFASVQGGAYDEQRKECIQKSIQKDIDGVVLHSIENVTDLDERIRQIRLTMEEIGEAKDTLYSVYSSKGSPVDVILGVTEGIDFFEVDYPNYLSQNNLALNFNFEAKGIYEKYDPLQKSDINALLNNKTSAVLDLTKYDEFKDQLTGFVDGCECYACKNHTKAYVAHLIKCKELTGTILLTIHNVHQYNIFFAQLQSAAKNKDLPNYCTWFIQKNLV